MLEGLDEQKVARPMPLEIARRPETLLAYALNGGDLPPDNGYPLLASCRAGSARIASSGSVGSSCRASQSRSSGTRPATRCTVPIGRTTPPSLPPIKSTVALDWEARLKAGQQVIRGFAWSPHGLIERVECSLDGGASWKSARIVPPNQRLAWVRWELDWDAAPGDYTIMTRAIDDQGNRQPDSVKWNSLGYLYNAVVAHPVKVQA